jgi:hypothetical protein
MRCRPSCKVLSASVACAIVALSLVWTVNAQNDLDPFMRQVLERRDQNWTKLQQYVLDERERFEVRGPTGAPLWGERRDYTWFLRDGFFVRSPLRVNGAAVGEADRRSYEADFIRRARERERRRAAATGRDPSDSPDADDTPDVETLIRQSRQPQFVSTAYFLRFRFEPGRYALVGRESIDGREVLRVEYYPTALFREPRQRTDANRRRDDPADRELRRLMNKVSLVTLWIEPGEHQILKYTFDNVAVDFLPSQWLARVNDVRAMMMMGEPFPDVWLPKSIDIAVSGTLAVGQFDLQYGVEYFDYRRADVGSKVIVPDGR